jgi:alkylhydroperoxidase family enzyme
MSKPPSKKPPPFHRRHHRPAGLPAGARRLRQRQHAPGRGDQAGRVKHLTEVLEYGRYAVACVDSLDGERQRLWSASEPGSDDNPEQQAISTLARKVASAPAQVTAADLAPLRDHGFRDADVLDVVLATAIRCFSAR